MSSKVVIPLSDKDYLTQSGYSSHDPVKKRRKALEKGIKWYGYKAIVLRLNALSIRLKNRNPELSNQIKEDMAYLKIKYRSK